MANFAFSTGKLTVALYGSDYATGVVVAAVDSADFASGFQTKEVREAACVNLMVVDNVQYDNSVTLKVDFKDIAEKLIEWTTGAVKTTTGGANVYTISGAPGNKPKYIKVKLEGQLSDGRALTLELPRCKGITFPLSLKREDYSTPTIEFTAYPVDATSAAAVLTFALA